MEKRCDRKENCIDGSDEHDCGKLIIRKGYKKELTPILENGRDVVVDFFLNLLNIEISEAKETFTSRISFTRNWFDGRLMYKHLKNVSGTKMNVPSTDETEAHLVP